MKKSGPTKQHTKDFWEIYKNLVIKHPVSDDDIQVDGHVKSDLSNKVLLSNQSQ